MQVEVGKWDSAVSIEATSVFMAIFLCTIFRAEIYFFFSTFALEDCVQDCHIVPIPDMHKRCSATHTPPMQKSHAISVH